MKRSQSKPGLRRIINLYSVWVPEVSAEGPDVRPADTRERKAVADAGIYQIPLTAQESQRER